MIEDDRGWDEVLSEGFDPTNTTGIGPVYWRVVRRGDKQFYLSTHFTPAAAMTTGKKGWGEAGIAYCDPDGLAVTRIENCLSDLDHDHGKIEPDEGVERAAQIRRGSEIPSFMHRLEEARPHLIMKVRFENDDPRSGAEVLPVIDRNYDWDHIYREGPTTDALGPVYWRVVRRDTKRLYLITARIPHKAALRVWNKTALADCPDETVMILIEVTLKKGENEVTVEDHSVGGEMVALKVLDLHAFKGD